MMENCQFEPNTGKLKIFKWKNLNDPDHAPLCWGIKVMYPPWEDALWQPRSW